MIITGQLRRLDKHIGKQIRSPISENLQVSEPPMLRTAKRVTSQAKCDVLTMVAKQWPPAH